MLCTKEFQMKMQKKPAVAHVIPKMFSSNDAVNDNPHTVFYCSNDCSILSQSNIV